MSEFLVPAENIGDREEGSLIYAYKDKRCIPCEGHIIIRVPQIDYNEGQKYVQPVLGESGEVIFRRQYYLDFKFFLEGSPLIVVPSKEDLLRAIKEREIVEEKIKVSWLSKLWIKIKSIFRRKK